MTETMKQINKLIDEAGYSQRRFAQECGVTETSLSRWLKGKSNPNIEFVETMLNVLNQDPLVKCHKTTVPTHKEVDIAEIKQEIRSGRFTSFVRNGRICLQDTQTTETVVIGDIYENKDNNFYYA